MKLALIVPGGVDRSGREKVIPVLLGLIERLARRHQVLVVALEQEREWSRYTLRGATVVNLGEVSGAGRLGRWLARFRGLLRTLRQEGGHFDILHALWLRGPGSLAVAAGQWLGIPVVTSVGGGELMRLPEIGYGGQTNWLAKLETAFVTRRADAVTAPSHYSLQPLGARRRDALWLPWSVDTRLFDSPVERPPGPPWHLLNVASLNAVKDHATLLRAVRIVLDRCQGVQLDVIGEDTLGGAIERLSAELKLGEAVKFHGFKTQEEIAPFYRRAHLYVQSSRHESMGASVLEAAAAGVPTVGTAVGLVAELAPSAALAVPIGDAPTLAKGILSLLQDPQQRESLGHAAQAFARRHDADWTAAEFEKIYARLARGRGTAANAA
jgi:glycosyltransferase involved in cell wall biosynthesis